MTREYGAAGRIGVGTPQANPTVEAEFRRLLPADVEFVTTRLTSALPSPRGRLQQYLERLDASLETFGGMRLDLFCFACTGSSYLLGHQAEQHITACASARFGYPVLTATEAIARRLHRANARRMAVVAPYPDWLLDAAAAYWATRGVKVTLTQPVRTPDAEDTKTIYDLTSADALAAVREAGIVDADLLLLSGTGMATLRALANIGALAGVPVLTSNIALAEEALRLVRH